MNQIIVSGRVSKEINIKGKTGIFTLANDRDYPFNKDQNGNKISNFITCKVLGEKNIERVQKWLTKGTAIIVTGHYYRDTWKDGNEYKEFNYILVEKWEFQIGKGNESEGQTVDNSEPQQVTNQQTNQQSEERPSVPDDAFMSIPDDLGDIDALPFK